VFTHFVPDPKRTGVLNVELARIRAEQQEKAEKAEKEYKKAQQLKDFERKKAKAEGKKESKYSPMAPEPSSGGGFKSERPSAGGG
jgi:hypothetical protein